jgi:Tfp pilus assembly protein PilO
MTRGHAGRLWAVGGAFGAAVLVALAWFFLISPQRAETAALQEEADAARTRVGTLQARTTELENQYADLPEYQAKLDSDRQALPTDSGLSDFLRQMQVAGDRAGVSVNGVIVGEPTLAPAGGGQVYSLSITLTVGGNATNLSRFLDQIQKVQPRAVLVGAANLAAADPTTSINGPSGLTVNVQVFVATPAAPGTTTTSSAPSGTTPATEGTD